MKYSPELIRQLSDPEYAKAEEQYAREAKRRKNGQNKMCIRDRRKTRRKRRKP